MTAGKPQGTRKRNLGVSEEEWPCQNLNDRFLASRTVGQYCSKWLFKFFSWGGMLWRFRGGSTLWGPRMQCPGSHLTHCSGCVWTETWELDDTFFFSHVCVMLPVKVLYSPNSDSLACHVNLGWEHLPRPCCDTHKRCKGSNTNEPMLMMLFKPDLYVFCQCPWNSKRMTY